MALAKIVSITERAHMGGSLFDISIDFDAGSMRRTVSRDRA